MTLQETLARISHTTNREVTVWATGSRFRADFVFAVCSDRSARAGRVSASKVARLAGGDGRAGSVCDPHWRCWRVGLGSSGIEGTMRRGEDCLVWTA
jgi:hypothetical protein